MKLQVQRLRPDAVLPGRAYAGDAGFDLVACERVVLAPGERASVGTGLAVATWFLSVPVQILWVNRRMPPNAGDWF